MTGWRWWQPSRLFPLIASVSALLALASLGAFGLDPNRGLALAVGALAKLAMLVAAAGYAMRCVHRLDSLAWRFMAGGFVGYALGQGCLVVYQLLLGVPSPFPSWADLFFVLGSVLLIVALWVFLVELQRSGCPLELRRRLPTDLLWILGLGGSISWWILGPIIDSSEAPRDIVLSLVYPVTDLLLLVPALLLFQVTGIFRGGAIRSLWATLLAGMVLFLIGDLLFSIFTETTSPWLGWAVDTSFLAGYALAARACALQVEMTS